MVSMQIRKIINHYFSIYSMVSSKSTALFYLTCQTIGFTVDYIIIAILLILNYPIPHLYIRFIPNIPYTQFGCIFIKFIS